MVSLYPCFRRAWLVLLVFGLLAQCAAAGTPALAAAPSLADALNPDGTLRAGASGSFDARRFRLSTAPDGRPVFRPAGTTGAGDERWRSGFGLPSGTDNQVWAVARFGNDVYIGGNFTVVGNVAARYVARWNGTAWSGLGSGPNGVVNALAVSATGELYAGGQFTQAGAAMARNVARWNGSSWSALGTGLTGTNSATAPVVYALAVAPGGDVYAGGYFTQAGSLTDVNNIARWDGTAWNRLGTVVYNGTNSFVKALAVAANGDLYVGGQFTQAGSVNANRIAAWNGTAWRALGQGIGSVGSDGVFALAFAPNGDLYAGGVFVQAGGRAANALARWNGAAWAPIIAFPATGLGNGVNSYVQALAVAANGDLYVGGLFTQAGRTNTNGIAKWNGTAWSTLGAGLSRGGGDGVYALSLAASGEIYAGGRFDRSGTLPLENLARWTGAAWTLAPGTAALGLNQVAHAVAVAPNGDVYVGGSFTQAGGTAVNYIAKWNGTAWSALGSGNTAAGNSYNLPPSVSALALAPNGDLYVGGYFSVIGGVLANNIARWNGSTWSTLGSGSSNGVNGGSRIGHVDALVLAPNGDLYAGGAFVSAGGQLASYVARWNGSAWSSLGSGTANGLNAGVNALVLAPSGDLYAAGVFTQAGGQPANRVARWNGSSWSPLGPGLARSGSQFGSVSALVLGLNGELYAGGDFDISGTVSLNHVARWDGAAWHPVGAGVGSAGSGYVSRLAVGPDGDLYAGGSFTQAGTMAATNMARYGIRGWSALGTGLNYGPSVLTFGPNGLLYAGGYFTTTGDGSRALAYFAIYDPAAPLGTASATAAPPALFPNPARSMATLRLPASAPRRPLTLLDAQGRIVRRYPAPAGAEATLDLHGLPVGVYLVQYGAVTQRLVVE